MKLRTKGADERRGSRRNLKGRNAETKKADLIGQLLNLQLAQSR